ncbi:DUF2059 domain-containing protein [Seohaeicola zhoushanensis]|uniref:DUF2059 domain-containing protein n=1 Tax=Seohaeicola zhoushanensis TaxID=1569283 RepID=A0A8J3H0G2_9RHOB|nr:DUF2059 domain-containing protein [Seohaeicola zhoushanensis]GHF58788.1 hypothetical protein GCM10017056_32740 [Seohaeicola zhoushanensis]
MAGLLQRILMAVGLVLAFSLPAHAADEVMRLDKALHFDAVVQILREEGLDYGRDLDGDMLGGEGGAHFAGEIDRIYDAARITEVMRAKLAETMTPEEMAECLAFLESPVGQRIMGLEVSARQAMSDEEVTEIAKASYADAAARGLPRIEMIARFIKINELVDRNVAGALSSNYRFLRGMSDGGQRKLSEGEIMDRVWEQEPDVRKDTIDWMNGFLYMAYGPLSDDEMQAYLDFSASPAGQKLNKALFSGFDAAYDRIYYEIGQAAARALSSRDL